MSVSEMPARLGRIRVAPATVLAMAPVSIAAFAAAVDPNWVRRILIVLVAGVVLPRLPRLGNVDLLALALGVWALIVSVGHAQSAEGPAVYLSVAALFVGARHAINTRERLLAVAGFYIAGCAYAAWRILGQPAYDPLDNLPRPAVAPGVNANYTAYAVTTGVALTLAIVVTVTSRQMRWTLVAVGCYLAYAVVRSDCRGALLGIIAALAFLAAYRYAPRLTWRFSVAGCLAALVAVPIGWLDDRLPRLESTFGRTRDSGNLSVRLYVWPDARRLFADAPWFGHGVGSFQAQNSYGVGAHNLILTLGCDLGLVGIALFCAVVALTLAPLVRSGVSGRRLAGLLFVTSTPIWLSGHWEVAAAAWAGLAIWSRLPLAPDGGQPLTAVRTSHFESAELYQART